MEDTQDLTTSKNIKEAFDEGMILLSIAFLLFLFRIFVPDIRILHVFFSGSLILKREF